MSKIKKITCSDVKVLLNRYQDKELSSVDSGHISTHLNDCESCQREYMELAALTADLKRLPEVNCDSYFTSRVMGNILAQKDQKRLSWLWERLSLPSSHLLLRMVYSFVFLIFLVFGFLLSNSSVFNLNNSNGNSSEQETVIVKLLVESQDLSLINVQDTTLALLVDNKGEKNE